MKRFSEHLYANALDNLVKLGQFIVKHNLPKVIKKEMENSK